MSTSKRILCLLAIGTMSSHVSIASAQCSFEPGFSPTSGKATFTMVRDYAGCPSAGHSAAVTAGGATSCQPVFPTENFGLPTTYIFAPTGYCKVTLKSGLKADCSTVEGALSGQPLELSAIPCHVTTVTSLCKNVATASGVLIESANDGWTLSLLLRITTDDRTGGDMTVSDYPVSIDYQAPSGGTIELLRNTAEIFLALAGPPMAMQAPCTSIEIVDMTIKDPLGRGFAKRGLATRGL